MTKYILNSGGASNYPEKEKVFLNEIVKGLDVSPKMLLCFFAQPGEEWEKRFQNKSQEIKDILQEKVTPTFYLALPDSFEKQSHQADVIYISGGDDNLVLYCLKQFDLPRIWEGKVVATSSASSHALSKQFWTCDFRKCMDGLGILPIKFLAHFKSSYGATDPRGPIDWDKAYQELENYGDKTLPIYALEEGDYKIFEL